MKYLKLYNETKAFESGHDLTLIKEILLELKHEYPSIKGEIVTHQDNNNNYLIIVIEPMPIYNSNSVTISKIEKRLKYMNDVISCCKRLIDALEVEVRIQGLFEDTITSQERIKIWIDDYKNKGKPWGGGI